MITNIAITNDDGTVETYTVTPAVATPVVEATPDAVVETPAEPVTPAAPVTE